MRNDTESSRHSTVESANETRAPAFGTAKPTLLGVMTDLEVHNALLKRIKAMKPDDQRRLLVDLGTG